jgi:DNA-binding NarL/FixJ family response regulator
MRVLLVDDHAVVRECVRLFVQAQEDMEVVGQASDGEEACQMAKVLRPDVIVLDISMPKLDGLQAAERLKAICPQAKVVTLSTHSDVAHVQGLLAAGADGYILKHSASSELIRAIRAVSRGEVYLDPTIASRVASASSGSASSAGSPPPNSNVNDNNTLTGRELEVFKQLACGHTNAEIANQMHISIKTVETHKARALQKLNLETRADIVSYALQQGWMQSEL